jgi:hypothetical protein
LIPNRNEDKNIYFTGEKPLLASKDSTLDFYDPIEFNRHMDYLIEQFLLEEDGKRRLTYYKLKFNEWEVVITSPTIKIKKNGKHKNKTIFRAIVEYYTHYKKDD